MRRALLKMSDIRNEEQAFERHYGNYTIKLWHYLELFDLLENCQDPENFKTISSTLNIKFALMRYQKILNYILRSESITSELNSLKKKRKIKEQVLQLEKMIAVLKIFEKKINEEPDMCRQIKIKKANILNIDKCYLFKV